MEGGVQILVKPKFAYKRGIGGRGANFGQAKLCPSGVEVGVGSGEWRVGGRGGGEPVGGVGGEGRQV